jgi:type IV secretion system protein VirD4
MKNAILFIYAIIASVFEGLVWLLKPLQKGKQFNASFSRVSSIANYFNTGFSINGGGYANRAKIATMNTLAIGKTGSGKSCILTSSVFTLARGLHSLVILDVGGVLYNQTSGYLHSKGYKIYRVSFENSDTDSYNPILDCVTVSDCEKLADLLILNGNVSSKNDPFWASSASQGLKIFICYVAIFAPQELRRMQYVVELLNIYSSNPEECDKLFIKTNPALLKEYKAFNSISQNTRQSILVTIRTAIKVYSNETVAACTAKTTIPFASFRNESSVLYITLPINDMTFYASFSSVLFERVFKEIFKTIPTAKQKSIFLLIDELVLFRFKNLGIVFSNIRKFRGGILGLIQDQKMLAMNFSEAECHSILSNTHTRIYLPGTDHKTSQELEKEFGTTQIKDEHNHLKTVPLLSAAEIRLSTYIYILVSGKAPVQTRLKKFYKHIIFKKYANMIPYQKPIITNDK